MSLFNILSSIGGGGIHPDAESYFTAAGITNPSTQTAVNTFVTTLNSASIWSKAVGCGLFLSGDSTIAQALVNIKYPIGFQSLANNGTSTFNNTHYISNLGVRSANTTYKADLGYTPASQGLDKDNFCVCVGVTDDVTDLTTQNIFLDNKATGTASTAIAKLSNNMSGGTLSTTVASAGAGVPYLGTNSSNGSVNFYRDFHDILVPTAPPAVTFDTNMSLFSGRNAGVASGATVAIGFYWISSYLTEAEVTILHTAVRALWRSLGRMSSTKEAVFLGDSITLGLNASTPSARWSRLLASSYGLVERNCGLSGSQFLNNNGILPKGYDRFSDLLKYDIYSGGKLVFFHGVNDCRTDTGATGLKTAQFQADLTTKLLEARNSGLSASQVIVGSIPYINDGTPQTRQDAYAAAALAAAQAAGCYYADINAYMLANGGNTLLSGDNLHPNDTGHSVIKDGFLTAAAV